MPTLPNQLDLILDVDSGRLLKSFFGNKASTVPVLTFGDSLPVTVRPVRLSSTADPDLPWADLSLPNHNIRLGVGTPANDPTLGTFQLTFDSNTTTNLAYNATASAVQTALNALTTIQSAGNVAITAAGGGGYRAAFNNVGARNTLTADTTPLYPTSAAYINKAQTGNATVRDVQLIRIETQPSAYIELTDALPSAAATITTTRAGVTNTTSELQTVDLSTPEPYSGTWTLTTAGGTTGALAYDISASALQAALIATDSTNYTAKINCTGAFPLWTVEWDSTLGDVAALTADVTDLFVPTGRRGNLNLNTAGIQELLDGSPTKQAKLEVEIYNTTSSTSWTPLQTPVTVREDLVPSSPASQTPLPTYLSAGDTTNITGTWTFDSTVVHRGTFITDSSVAVGGPFISTGTLTCTNATVSLTGLPTSTPGGSGRLWNDSGTLKIT